MAETAADRLIETITKWGVDTVFGIPDDGINGLMESLRVRQDGIRFFQVRYEEAAAFMACAYGKYRGKLGCCLATSGPGGIHLLNGLYDAQLDQPLILWSGMADRFQANTGTGRPAANSCRGCSMTKCLRPSASSNPSGTRIGK